MYRLLLQDEYELVLTNPLPRSVTAQLLLANELDEISPALAALTMEDYLAKGIVEVHWRGILTKEDICWRCGGT